jgi:hypothetical protein
MKITADFSTETLKARRTLSKDFFLVIKILYG